MDGVVTLVVAVTLLNVVRLLAVLAAFIVMLADAIDVALVVLGGRWRQQVQ